MRMQPIPSLPEPRYSPALALLGDGRLHLFGGLMPDRATPARDHWSLAVNADGSTGDAWVAEPLLPAYLGGSHGTVVQLHPRGDEMRQQATSSALPTASGAMQRCGPSTCTAAGAATVTCLCPCNTPLAAPSSWARTLR
ncbi:kelch repeat-containing protein [Chlorella sorokiniana]|uniref:Kelch repeat-containing protein n=1 Tax=Chlorella sorokiniana TaxID=3076 RepID=A0A2P6U4R0_CHLSO|nr:kelch repeat-containing protein [Chlorella sorokiniana]|eukprot:PRW61300.1 kelch repeat-containing protein [Chlorella sorokiniana]